MIFLKNDGHYTIFPNSFIDGLLNILIITVVFITIIYFPWKIYKKLIDSTFSIIFLRKFDEKFSAQAFQKIMPSLGMYGKATTIVDAFFYYHQSVNGVRSLLLNLWGVSNSAIIITQNNWKIEVLKALQKQDAVIIDFLNPTNHIEWEINTALPVFPPHREGKCWQN